MDIFGTFNTPQSWGDVLKGIASRGKTLASADITAVKVYQEASLYNVSIVNQALKSQRAEVFDTFTDIEHTMRQVFGTRSPFQEFLSEISDAFGLVERARNDLSEITAFGYADSKLIGAFEKAALDVESNAKRVQKQLTAIAAQTSQQVAPPDLEMAKFQEAYAAYATSRQHLNKLNDKIKYKLRVAQKVRQNTYSFYKGGIQKAFKSMLSGTKSFYHAVVSGNGQQAFHILKSFKENLEEYKASIEASATQQKMNVRSPMLQGQRMLVQKTMIAFTGALLPMIEGFELLIKPLTFLLSSGVFGIIKLVYEVFAAASGFNKQMFETRGTRQFTYDIDFSLPKEDFEALLESKFTKFRRNMLDTSYNPVLFKTNTSNMYNITNETFTQIDNLVSNIHLNRIRDELDKSMTTNDAQMILVNEVLTFSKGLGASYAEIASTMDQLIQESQFSLTSVSDSFSYISKLAFAGNFSALRLLTTYRNVQSSLLGLNTRISGTLGLIALLHKSKFMNENQKQKFLGDLKSFAADHFSENIVGGLVTKKDFEDIYDFIDSQTIVGNRQADSLYMGEIRRSIDRMNDPLLHEGAIINLEHLLSQDPSAQFAYTLVNLRKRLLGHIDIFTASSQEIADFISSNQTLLEDVLGREYRQMGTNVLELLARIKLMHSDDTKTLKGILKHLSVRDAITGKAIDPEAAAQVEYQNMQANLMRYRDQYTDIFNSWKNKFDDFLAQASVAIPDFFAGLMDVFTLFVGHKVKFRDVVKSFDEVREAIKDLRNAQEADKAEARQALFKKIQDAEKLEQSFFDQLKDTPSVSVFQERLNMQRPKVTNETVTVTDMLGAVSADAVVKYHSDYAGKISMVIDKLRAKYLKNLDTEHRAGMSEEDVKKAYDEFKKLPSQRAYKNLESIGFAQYQILLYTMLGEYKDPKQAVQAVHDFLSIGFTAALTGGEGGFFDLMTNELRAMWGIRQSLEEGAKEGLTSLHPVLGGMVLSPGLLFPICQVFKLTSGDSLSKGDAQAAANTRKAMMLGLLKAAAQVPEALSILSDTEGDITAAQAGALSVFHQIMERETMAAGRELQGTKSPASEAWLKELGRYVDTFKAKTKRRVIKVTLPEVNPDSYTPMTRHVAAPRRPVQPGERSSKFDSRQTLDAGTTETAPLRTEAADMIATALTAAPQTETFDYSLPFIVSKIRELANKPLAEGETRTIIVTELHLNDVQFMGLYNGIYQEIIAPAAITQSVQGVASQAAKEFINRIQ